MKTTNRLTAKRALVILTVLTVVMVLTTLIPPIIHAAPSSQSGAIVYYVRYGDTLFSISRRFGTTVPAIMAANGLTSYYVYAGQRLTIPVGYPSYGFQSPYSIYAPQPLPTQSLIPNPTFGCTYTVQTRDTVFSISYRYQVTIPSLMQANNLYSPYIFVGEQLSVPCLTPTPAAFPMYTVQSGDDLFRIAIQYNTSIYAIALVNGLPNPDLVFAGQNLVVPYPGSYVWPTGIPTLAPTSTPAPTTTGTPATATPTITTTPTAPPNTGVVIMQNIAFVPPIVTIQHGQTVLWRNADSVNHAIVSGTPGAPDGKFQSGTLAPGQSYQFTFTQAGTYPYFDAVYGVSMTGQVIVQ